ncbi:hypothetical protein [Streptomyces sp. NPDC046805]|uniref:hypothetical protein n=1 Tax=Streptomyces sp. NPDC046805 TaxID=3155134 RepID=UPI0033F9D3EC
MSTQSALSMPTTSDHLVLQGYVGDEVADQAVLVQLGGGFDAQVFAELALTSRTRGMSWPLAEPSRRSCFDAGERTCWAMWGDTDRFTGA